MYFLFLSLHFLVLVFGTIIPQNVTNSPHSLLQTRAGPGFRSGITYSHYLANGHCRSAAQVSKDVSKLIDKGHDLIRIYGVDCNGPANLFAAVRGKSVKGRKVNMFLGIYHWQNAATEARSIASQLGNDWSQVNTISVGNEIVNGGGQADQVIAAMAVARSTLRAVGYTGPVVTTDTMIAVINNPSLCTAADYCAMNCHAFFDGTFSAAQAGHFLEIFIKKVQVKIGNQPIVITESGWPRCGQNNNKAIAGVRQQSIAIASFKFAMPTNLIQFEGYNSLWKNPGNVGNEHCWGVYGDSPSAP